MLKFGMDNREEKRIFDSLDRSSIEDLNLTFPLNSRASGTEQRIIENFIPDMALFQLRKLEIKHLRAPTIIPLLSSINFGRVSRLKLHCFIRQPEDGKEEKIKVPSEIDLVAPVLEHLALAIPLWGIFNPVFKQFTKSSSTVKTLNIRLPTDEPGEDVRGQCLEYIDQFTNVDGLRLYIPENQFTKMITPERLAAFQNLETLHLCYINGESFERLIDIFNQSLVDRRPLFPRLCFLCLKFGRTCSTTSGEVNQLGNLAMDKLEAFNRKRSAAGGTTFLRTIVLDFTSVPYNVTIGNIAVGGTEEFRTRLPYRLITMRFSGAEFRVTKEISKELFPLDVSDSWVNY